MQRMYHCNRANNSQSILIKIHTKLCRFGIEECVDNFLFLIPKVHNVNNYYLSFINSFLVWVYSTISIVVISLCGLLGVAVIPVMGKSYYHQLIQFLVALAIGTLCGDALIHLLPHVSFFLFFIF